MKAKIVSIAILGIAALGQIALAQRVEYDNRELNLSPRPTPVGDTWLLPVRALADRIGARIDHSRRYASISWGRNRAEFQIGDRYYNLNGRQRTFRYEPLERRGTLFIEAEFFEELTDGRLRVYGGRYGGTDDWRNDRRNDRYSQRRDDQYGYNNRERITFDGRELRFNRGEEPFTSGSTLLVPFRTMGEQIGARLDRTDDGKRVIIRYGRNEVVYDRGRTWYRINGQRRELRSTGRDRGDIYFVPIELFDAVTNGRIEWDRRRY